MKICYLSHAENYHTKKWANHFSAMGNEVHVLSLENTEGVSGYSEGVELHWLRCGGSRAGGDLQKIKYLAAIPRCKKLLNDIKPDIIHAHYATSYGLICALSSRKPYFLSVWGSDVYEFPRKSAIHSAALKFALSRCAYLLSTSRAMAKETRKYTEKEISVTPFGVDMRLFRTARTRRNSMITIGTVKALEPKYGIDTLLKACAIIKRNHPDLDFELRIAGKGRQEQYLKSLAVDLGISERVVWLGFISQEEVAREWANLDVAVVSSSSESFGVSAVEAQACGAPLIITDIPGLKEACCNGRTAVVVQPKNPDSLADGIMKLLNDPALRREMSRKGRMYVAANYEANHCFSIVEHLYQQSLGSGKAEN